MFGEILREEDATERVPDEDDTVSQERNVPLEMDFPILISGIILEGHPRSYDFEIPSECRSEVLITPADSFFQRNFPCLEKMYIVPSISEGHAAMDDHYLRFSFHASHLKYYDDIFALRKRSATSTISS